MNNAMDKLLSICSDNISMCKEEKDISSLYSFPLVRELEKLLDMKNGAYGFESALHIYPFETVGLNTGLLDWNNYNLWISAYGQLAIDSIYFAEDIFGGQFCIKIDGVYSFDPETGRSEKLATCLDDWCNYILDDYNYFTGYSLAHAWQKKHGVIPVGYRLIPRVPFVMGGEFSIDNLVMKKSEEAMKIRASIALQIKDLKDGDAVELKYL
ncbi:hypothetical protein [Pectobacterium polaris]|uniref:hypothetical protein n=1 Tax=Pectobacterium polaris TaxID=2042057 RepID=UPI001C2E2634|nr:hypothetical protein [Pectobacterium polaris]